MAQPGSVAATQIQMYAEPAGPPTTGQQEQHARRLLAEANRLLRWYRFLVQDPAVAELQPAGLVVSLTVDGQPWGPNGGLVEFGHPISPAGLPSVVNLGEQLAARLASPDDPPVWQMLLLDARAAQTEGR